MFIKLQADIFYSHLGANNEDRQWDSDRGSKHSVIRTLNLSPTPLCLTQFLCQAPWQTPCSQSSKPSASLYYSSLFTHTHDSTAGKAVLADNGRAKDEPVMLSPSRVPTDFTTYRIPSYLYNPWSLARRNARHGGIISIIPILKGWNRQAGFSREREGKKGNKQKNTNNLI